MRARLLPLLAVAVAAPAWAAELNVITSVEVNDTGSEVVVAVKGSRKPSFTTFSMADPPRFVIDFSESKFQGVAEDMPGAGGVIKQVKALSYGSDASAIARVMIAFATEVDPPAVEDAGDRLVVRVAKPGGTAVAAAPDATASERASADADAKAKAKADADAKARADEDRRQAKADADAKAKADADAKARADEDRRQAKVDADAKAKADADAKARAKADADAQAKADADAKARARADADAQAKADADAKARAKADADAQAKADADAKARAKADADAQAKADADAKARAKADADAQAKAGATATPARAADADQKELDAEIAAAREEARATKGSVETLSPEASPALVREVGFKQLRDASRVFVRTSSPAQFTIQDVDERTVRIEVGNTRATRYNDLRFLDTSFFPSAVQMITPSRQGTSYVLTVKLRQRVPYQQRKEGDMLAIDFQRPPATAAASPQPGADAPDSGEPSETPEE